MEQNVKISGTQLSMLLFISVTSTITIYVPGYTAKDAKESAWLAASVIPFIFGYLTLWTVNKLGCIFPKLTIFQYSVVIMGKLIGKSVAIGYLLFLLGIDVLVAREFSDFLEVTTLPLTPRIWLLSSIVLLACYGAYKGLEGIARASQFILGIYLLGFVTAILASLVNFKIDRLLPVLEEGLWPVVRGSSAPASWYGEMCLIAMLFPYVNKPKEVKRKGMIALVAITLFVTIDVVVTVGVLGVNLTSAVALPFWTLAKNIDIGDVVQRFESFLLVYWISGIIIKETLIMYLLSMGITQVFSLRNTKAVLSIIALVVVGIAQYILGNSSQVHIILTDYWPYIRMGFELCVPGVLLIFFMLRKKHLGV